MSDRACIHVTHHVREQARTRFPELRQLPDTDLTLHIVREVGAALRNDRVACRAPRFVLWNGGRRVKSRHHGHVRYAWSSDELRAYVIRRVHDGWVVITAITGRRQEAAAA